MELRLASRTAPPEELLPEARKLAMRLAEQPGPALQATKRVVNMHLSRALAGAVQAGFALEEVTMTSEEHLARLRDL